MALPGHHHDLPDKGFGEGLAIGQLALLQKLAHVLRPRHDGLQVVLTDLRWERMD